MNQNFYDDEDDDGVIDLPMPLMNPWNYLF